MGIPDRAWFLRALLCAGLFWIANGQVALAEGTDRGAGEEGREALNRMVEALDQHSYEGIFVYARAGVVETVHIVHRAGDSGRHQRLEMLTGSHREMIRTPEGALLAGPIAKGDRLRGSGVVTSLGEGWPRADSISEDLYRIQLQGEGRVAGRPTTVIAVEPLDQLRYGHRLWVDEESGLPLHAQLLDGRRVIERLLFTSFTLRDDIDAEELEPVGEAQRRVERRLAEESDDSGEPEWEVIDVPAGFSRIAHGRIPSPEPGQDPIEHLLFSDGLASVSVYIAPEPGGNEGQARAGALHAYERPVEDHQVTAIGDVPAKTVERFARQTRRR
ncbi:MucB/RseB C-terminal domain-containing protein [Halorhodospira halophila]|uniref:Sigma E regulatory protein, MucB/RseB n=1 Tax=Halorhodospira halophila (strain DSM 244 / SL1) TaxID=349124 RepID=A1WT21_HALHL|nr:MucB/RseB C-terminal domain-containing protein [Halorhodospira halophila]ABM60833.1 sigma E regulatory protein, MucB/RseB [Halorhodospira halophila SL1]MBK1728488.1 hypothetical protein [Halorhodospira halophila]